MSTGNNLTPPTHGKFYWVKAFKAEPFEPAACRNRYGDGVLYFCFTNGGVMQVGESMEYVEIVPPVQ